MSHIHNVTDSDNKFIVDGVNRSIKNASTSKTMVCYISRLPVNFNEFNSWSEPTEYDLSNAKFTTLGTLILSNEVIETWSSTNTNTKVIYFNKNCEI